MGVHVYLCLLEVVCVDDMIDPVPLQVVLLVRP